jgi:5-methylcytosine-specific restriction endonuclease McrA
MTVKITPTDVRSICQKCGVRPQVSRGNGKFRHVCDKCYKNRSEESAALAKEKTKKHNLKRKRRPYLVHKKDQCELCGFIPVNLCQLDVDHIDGNHHNNDISNLQTLCANCHRLKTFLNRDWEVQ